MLKEIGGAEGGCLTLHSTTKGPKHVLQDVSLFEPYLF